MRNPTCPHAQWPCASCAAGTLRGVKSRASPSMGRARALASSALVRSKMHVADLTANGSPFL